MDRGGYKEASMLGLVNVHGQPACECSWATSMMPKDTIAYWRWGLGRTRPVHCCQNQRECHRKRVESVTGEHREGQGGRPLRRSH